MQPTTQNSTRISAEVAHVLFMDLVGFSLCPMEQQAALVDELRQVVRSAPEYSRALERGDLIGIDTGDGMALVFFRDPLAPVQCAVEIGAALKQHPHLHLRMGIHSGPVSRILDINGRENVTGSGINMAQRVMDCGDDGHILVSSSSADLVKEFETWSSRLAYLGEAEVKHGVNIRLYNLVTDTAGRSDLPARLSRQLQQTEIAPAAAATSVPRETIGGAVPLNSPYYVVRPTDQAFLEAIAARDSIVLVKGARQMGKTSLLARGLQKARAAGAHVVFTDFQTLSATSFASPDKLYQSLADSLVDQLDLDDDPRATWNNELGANTNLERFLRRKVLSKIDDTLIWGLDEVDRLFPPVCEFGSEVFGLFRSWHNRRSLDPEGPWSRLTLAIAYATEAHLLITDMNQSPFNVGTRLQLEDFDRAQVADLNHRYGEPLKNEGEIDKFVSLVGGHPYLVRRGLDEMVRRGLSVEVLEQEAFRDDGVFGDHLRRLVLALQQEPALAESIRSLDEGRPIADPESFYRLRSAGIIVGDTAADARFRCGLYAGYLHSRNL